MIEKQIDSMVRDFEMQLMYQGLKLEGYLEHYKKSMEEFRDGLRSEATERVRTQLTLEKVSQVEGITASEEELDKELEEMAKRYKMEDIEKFKESMGEDELNYIRESIIIRKTVDFLVGELTEK
jgi:trigger factor